VLRVLDEYRIPIDCIANSTALVGAATTGMSLTEMEQLLIGIEAELLFRKIHHGKSSICMAGRLYDSHPRGGAYSKGARSKVDRGKL
jgi:hypothetical protein